MNAGAFFIKYFIEESNILTGKAGRDNIYLLIVNQSEGSLSIINAVKCHERLTHKSEASSILKHLTNIDECIIDYIKCQMTE